MNYTEIATIHAVRSQYLGSERITDDALLVRMIRQASDEIQGRGGAGRLFVPEIRSLQVRAPRAYSDPLLFPLDLLEVTSITNGDGSAIAADEYDLLPLEGPPYWKMELYPAVQTWKYDSVKQYRSAVTITGVWGYHEDYGSAWETTGAALPGGIDDSVTSIAGVTAGLVHAGELLKVDSEYLYVSAVQPVTVDVTTTDTLTVTRGANGSTAAAHLVDADFLRWSVTPRIAELANQAALAHYKLRSNPTNETVALDGVTFVTPKDVMAWVTKQVHQMGLVREGFA